MSTPEPIVERHDGICGDLWVVRDDLLPGGTKTRFLPVLFEDADELVYASPAEGGMQLALAYTARALEKRATIFVAARSKWHARTIEAFVVGARIEEVRPGYLSVVQARARRYAAETPGARALSFGGHDPRAHAALVAAARSVAERYGPFPEVWCAAGSGVLSRALQAGIPDAEHFAVQVGRPLENPGRATVVVAGWPSGAYAFGDELRPEDPPFPACPNYDAKAWELAAEYAGAGSLFWNVLGPSPTPHALVHA